MAPAVAIIIGTRNRSEKAVPAIETALASDVDDLEVVVIDQSDNDETERATERFAPDPRFRYVRSEATGVSRARNEGVDNTSAPVIVITDDDCLVPPDWARVMTAPFHADPKVGVVFGSVVPLEPGKPGRTPLVRYPDTRTLTSVNQAWLASRTGMCLGASMAVRRSTFDEIGGFDPHLGPGVHFSNLEDNDLSWRCLLAGWRTHLTNEVEVVHDGFRDLDELRELVNRDFFGVGAGMAKYVRTFNPGAWLFIAAWLINFGVVGPAQEVLRGRRPRGCLRPYQLLRGLRAGMTAPLDKKHLLYEPKERTPGLPS